MAESSTTHVVILEELVIVILLFNRRPIWVCIYFTAGTHVELHQNLEVSKPFIQPNFATNTHNKFLYAQLLGQFFFPSQGGIRRLRRFGRSLLQPYSALYLESLGTRS